MSPIIETRRALPRIVLDVGDAFLGARVAPGRGRVRPRSQVRARALGRVTAPVETFDRPWQLVTTATPSGFLAWFGGVRPDAPGAAVEPESDRVDVLEPGTYDIEVTAPGYQTTVLPGSVPAAGARPTVLVVDLEAGSEYPFPDEAGPTTLQPGGPTTGATLIRGQILSVDGSGLVRVPVQAPSAVPAVTDRSGSFVLAFPDDTPSGPVTVTATIAGAAVTVASAVVSGRRTAVPQARLHGRTVRQSGAPAAGAVVSVSGISGAVTSGADGAWSFALPFGTGVQPLNVTVTAALGPITRTQAGVGVVPGQSVTVPDYVFPNP